MLTSATHLVVDALKDRFDTALLVCADADLVPAVRIAKDEGKRVLVSPRGRTSDHLVAEGDGHLHISNSVLGRCQLPDPVLGAVALHRPETWK